MSDTQTPGIAAVPKTALTHGECGRWWTGSGRAHCAAPGCHRTFSGDSAAERHRVGTPSVDRRCVDPASVGLVAREMPYGILWGWPGPDDDKAARLAELRGAA